MKFQPYILLLLLFAFSAPLVAQKIVYSEPDKDDSRRMNFEVIGKISGNFLIHKNNRNKNFISVYDNDMKQVAKEELDFLDSRVINLDFIPYTDHSIMIYQHEKRNVVYCNAVKLDGMGKKISEIVLLDTSHIGMSSNNRIYAVVASEDKNHILLHKINSRNRSNYIVTTILFDQNLALKDRSSLTVPMEERNDFLKEFNVDNDGGIVFTKFSRNSSDNVSNSFLITKSPNVDTFQVNDLGIEKMFLDEPQIKIDNVNKRYFLTSFYYKQRRGNIEGFYFYVWDKQTQRPSMQNTIVLSEELRREARGDANMKTAFNDYFIRNIIVKRDGGFIIGSEAYYTTSRFNNWNRWDYLFGSPYMNSFDYYRLYSSPLYNSWYWRNRNSNNNSNVRHHADNVTVLSFDNTGKLEWSNVIHKEQFDDEAGDRISYVLMNTGGQLRFLFNQEEKRVQLLKDFSLDAEGEITRNPTLKNLDRGYEFLPKFGKQVSARQMIIPCFYRNYICFAKIDYNS
jgi:hypothetical protein